MDIVNPRPRPDDLSMMEILQCYHQNIVDVPKPTECWRHQLYLTLKNVLLFCLRFAPRLEPDSSAALKLVIHYHQSLCELLNDIDPV